MLDTTKKLLSDVISNEIKLAVTQIDLMSQCHEAGYNGFKRLHRYFARDRFEHAIKLKNFSVDIEEYNPMINVTYITEPFMNVEGSVVKIYNLSEMHLEKLKTLANVCITENLHVMMGYIEKMITDQSEETKCFRRLLKEFANANQLGDKSYINIEDKYLHDKMKGKEIKKQNKDY